MKVTKERPILFNQPMVRAVLDGRKTQTRRICAVQPFESDGLWHAHYPWGDGGHGIYDSREEMLEEFTRVVLPRSPYGQPGDRLWGRETMVAAFVEPYGTVMTYAADGAIAEPTTAWPWKRRTVPSIHMPRWASRITLEVTEVRIERVQDISEADARAEGVDAWMDSLQVDENRDPDAHLRAYPVTAFQRMWDSIYGKQRNRETGKLEPGPGRWESNPWVWVVEFKVVQP